jgi:hypothetical protein
MAEVPHKIVNLARLGRLGRLMWSQDRGDAVSLVAFRSHLGAVHILKDPPKENTAWERVFGTGFQRRPDGLWGKPYDLGSGLVTNVGVLALANDMNWAAPSGAAVNLFKLLKYHASGKGSTAAAATDFKIETDSTVGGQTPVSGTQVFTPADNLQKIVSVATIAYTGTEAVTEWGWFNRSTLTDTTGSPFTATSSTGGTTTGTPLTASSSTVQGQQQYLLHTTTTPRIGLITSNTTSVFTIPNWLVATTGASGSTPGSTETYTIRPIMWDHKVFTAINVVNGDSIQFTYSLTINSGG